MMNNQIILKVSVALGLAFLMVAGCSINGTDTVKNRQPNNEIIEYGKSKKYVKNGITVVYLTGTPYKIGFAHGKLCKDEINKANKPFFEIYESLIHNPQDQWLSFSKKLEKTIPVEYL
ncbi:MAG: hypothetical protein ACR2PH_06330, partial [Desulfobulbia bacterium]